MKIIGVDLHTRQQSIAMLDDQTGELVEKELQHEGDQVRAFYSSLGKPVLVGLEATGSMHWFLRLLEELAIEFRVGHPAKIGRRNPASKKTTDAMRVCCSRCWRKSAFRRFGCLLASNTICRFCCGTAISSCVSAPACN